MTRQLLQAWSTPAAHKAAAVPQLPGRLGPNQPHLLCLVHLQLAAGKVVEEKHGLRAAGDNVVDAHGHQVDAHGVVLVHVKGQLQLGAHAVGARHQEGVACRQGGVGVNDRYNLSKYIT